MADIRISELEETLELNNSSIFLVTHNGTSKKIIKQNLSGIITQDVFDALPLQPAASAVNTTEDKLTLIQGGVLRTIDVENFKLALAYAAEDISFSSIISSVSTATNVLEALELLAGSVEYLLNGTVFITDVSVIGIGSVTNKVYDHGALTSFDVNSSAVTVTVVATSGPSGLIPNVTVNGTAVTGLVFEDGGWKGTANISLTSGTITATHEDGAEFVSTANILASPTGPVISSAVFNGAVYSPFGVDITELYHGRAITLIVTVDKQIDQIQVKSETSPRNGIAAQTLSVVPGSGVPSGPNYIYTIPFTTNVSETVPTNKSVSVRTRSSADSAWGNYYNTVDDFIGTAADQVQYFVGNNVLPILSITGVIYPVGQLAIKDAETATVQFSYSGVDSINNDPMTFSFTGSQVQLDGSETNIIGGSKLFTRNSGSYNITTNNFSVYVTRKSSGRNSATVSGRVSVANTVPSISFSLPAARLRSGGTNGTVAQQYTVTLTSTQALIAAPDVSIPYGTWIGTWSGSGTTWTRTISIADSDARGEHFFGLTSVENYAKRGGALNLAADSYTIGGFVARTITVDVQGSGARWVNLGTTVSDSSKLLATILFVPWTYQNSLTSNPNTYTIIDAAQIPIPSGTNPNGDTAYITDDVFVGTQSVNYAITIEETV